MLNLKIRKRQASPAGLRLSRQSARFEDLLRRTDKDALTLTFLPTHGQEGRYDEQNVTKQNLNSEIMSSSSRHCLA